MFLSTPLPRLLQPPVDDVKDEAAAVWNGRDATRRLGAFLAPWIDGAAADGAPMVTARVLGQHAEEAMHLFANGLEPVTASAEKRPQVDYSEEGVIACSWRRAGVWVRLWATDTAPVALTPLNMPAKTAAPSGRLQDRRNTTTCGIRSDYMEEN